MQCFGKFWEKNSNFVQNTIPKTKSEKHLFFFFSEFVGLSKLIETQKITYTIEHEKNSAILPFSIFEPYYVLLFMSVLRKKKRNFFLKHSTWHRQQVIERCINVATSHEIFYAQSCG